jgi:hypothetical protein
LPTGTWKQGIKWACSCHFAKNRLPDRFPGNTLFYPGKKTLPKKGRAIIEQKVEYITEFINYT